MTAKQGGLLAACNDVPGLFGYTAAALLLYTGGKRVVRPIFLWIDTFSYEWFLTHVSSIMWAYYYLWIIYPTELEPKAETVKALVVLAVSIGVAWLFAWLMRILMKLIAGKPSTSLQQS